MKAQFDQNLLSSFYLWLENRLLKSDTKAYITGLDNNFRYVDFDDIPADMVGYQGEYRQLVADYNIDVVNSGFMVNGGFVTGDSSANGGVYTDYENGRILFPEASGTGLNISGTYSVKEVNTYISHDDDVEFLVYSDFLENGQDSPYFYNETGIIDKGAYFLPACFVSLSSSENEEFSFGGEENTQSRVRVMILTKDSYILDSVISRLRDTVREKVTHIPYEDFPYAYSYSVKDFPYTYTGVVGDQGSSPLCSYIDRVTASKVVSEALREKLNKDFSIAFLDFDLSTYRFPRS
tara:strand:+ start:170 stop:1048 length:879 start_codon:yes stop_codon:yes gene_type:complete